MNKSLRKDKIPTEGLSQRDGARGRGFRSNEKPRPEIGILSFLSLFCSVSLSPLLPSPYLHRSGDMKVL